MVSPIPMDSSSEQPMSSLAPIICHPPSVSSTASVSLSPTLSDSGSDQNLNTPALTAPTNDSSSASPNSSDASSTLEDENSDCTTGPSPDHIGNSSLPLHTTSLISESTTSQPQASHQVVTRAKAGIIKPNPRYVLLAHKVSYPEPKTVTSALKHKLEWCHERRN